MINVDFVIIGNSVDGIFIYKHTRQVRYIPKANGLQNTSMYSALWASLRLFKFNPIEFSPAFAQCCPE